MSGSSEKSPGSKALLSVRNIVLAGFIWSILALLFFLLFSTPGTPGEDRTWYGIGTTIFELVAYIFASVLCFINWRSPQIVSGRNVWLAIGLGMLFYFLGGILFFYWETILGIEPAVSPGDFFYIPTYICLGYGLISAVFTRRLNLEIWQWAVVAGIAAVGIGLATWVSTSNTAQPQALFSDAVMAQTAPTQAKPAQPPVRSPSKAPAVKPAPGAKPPVAKPPVAKPTSPAPTTQQSPASPVVSPSPSETQSGKPAKEVPTWAQELEKQLAPLEGPIQLFYVVSDVVLLIMASILLLAYWGGRSSLSWRMIAAAAFCLYIADIYFKYASNQPSYQSGSLPEVFWIFSGVLFGIGAALEHDLSTRSRRAGSRRSARGT
ncbi:hypothetical protein BST81_08985 [Leptolyngbya sp. 'hensonii']|uniref:hypothetical protein n=1 Tax=Leptolyngbya sp. 'hensonii' TaxID=1922337 RepID=UPI00094F88C2|nr:hypothetical protein [Leptolyngbya sp. 'hensonii']OLP18769.1 hypothetical protein BST81_08985 [Leptolyngbya sp. 'hensonii']